MANYKDIAREYYNYFEWPGSRYILRSPYFWIFFASLAGFAYALLTIPLSTSPGNAPNHTIPHNRSLAIIIASEIVCLSAWFLFQYKKQKYLIARAQKQQGLFNAHLRILKRHILSRYLQTYPSEFSEVAKKIEAAAALEKLVADPRGYSLYKILGHVYSPDSKPRIYTLLGALIAIITALSIKNGASLADISTQYSIYSAKELLASDLLISLLIGLLFLILKQVFSFATIALDVFMARLDGKRGESQHMTHYLVRDLLTLHTAVHIKGQPKIGARAV